MEDGTYRSLHAILAIAFGILIIGAGCTGKTEPPQQSQNETSSQVQANAAPTKEEAPKAAVPFVACYRGEADLFSSTANVSEAWVDQLREQLNEGWLIDKWCRETDDSGASLYGLALRRSQGVVTTDLASSTFVYQQSGERKGGIDAVEGDQLNGWSLVRLAYIAASRNRSNEIPLLLSDPVAVKNEMKPVDEISLIGNLQDTSTAPRTVQADMRGGDAKGWFSVRFSYDPNTKTLVTDQYCRTYFDSEDGSFSPQDMKSECLIQKDSE